MVYEFLGLLVESYGTWLLLQRLVDASKDSDIPKNVPFALAINNRNTNPLALLGSRNPFFDCPTEAEIFLVHVYWTRRSPTKTRNDLYNQLAFNSLAVLSSTGGAKGTLSISLSATRENLWDIFRPAVSPWKSAAVWLTT